MKTIELKKALTEFLKQKGTESFTKLISDSIDESGPVNSICISATRDSFIAKFNAMSELNLTERGLPGMHPIFSQALKPFGIR